MTGPPLSDVSSVSEDFIPMHHAVRRARKEMGEARWAELNREWKAAERDWRHERSPNDVG